MSRRTLLSAVALAVAVTGSASFLVSPSAEAGGFLRRPVEGDYAVAVSRFGNGTVRGPVRETRTGYEVRKPNGIWIACRRSCSETLRVETVDFYETPPGMTGFGTALNECGIFGCLELTWPR
ncbi:hypothetical protein [Hyphomicrobium sp.]|uniref:hypothetical protein n=1 Tax=Hyphomicrobium sp. TaxID=82 RepID=UPI0025BAF982|nr:hypothetical protein [Hyphomicrobium sp.]MCC7251332.1 hypothetical protein [Hyphomicrobium sp.]